MLGNALIGLREGLEASLVVAILVAFLVKTDRRSELPRVWIGVGLAVAVSIGVTLALTLTQQALTFEAQETLGGCLSIIAVGFVTWMIFWMRSHGRTLSTEIEGKLDSAISMGPLAVVVVAALAVGREGLETALFLWAATSATTAAGGSSVGPLIGAAIGLAIAVALGIALYSGALRINLTRFFAVTGTFLIIVAGGVLSYGVHDLQEARFLPGLGNLAFDVSAQIPPDSWYGTLLKGVFNFSPATTWLELAAWLVYVIPVMALFWYLMRARGKAPATTSATKQPAAVPVERH